MEKLKPNVVGLSAGITVSILSAICFILVSVLPLKAVIGLANNLVHTIDFSSIAVKEVSLVGAIIGLIAWFIVGTFAGYLFVIIYNKAETKLK